MTAPRPAKTGSSPVCPAIIESLESRRLLAVTVDAEGIVIEGTQGDDTITISLSADDPNTLVIDDNGAITFLDIRDFGADYNRIFVFTGDFDFFGTPFEGAGNDFVAVDEANGTIPISMRIDSGIGDDTLIGGAGHDFLNGGTGDDSLVGAGGTDYLNGEDGDDTLEGDAGGDFLSGGADNDVLEGGAGHDDLNGEDGDDLLLGGNHNDDITGGEGSDTIRGGHGRDFIEGGGESDFIKGDIGNDTILGGEGDDEISGGSGGDMLFGQRGDDIINGNRGKDRIDGGDGEDELTGAAGPDVFFQGIQSSSSELLDFTDGVDFRVKGSMKLPHSGGKL